MTIARAIRYLMALAALLLVAWAFVDVGARAWRESRSVAGRTKLTVLHWGDAREDGIVAALVEEYARTHPKIAIERINAGLEMRSKLKTMLAAGTPPDVFYLPPDILGEMASLELIRPVDPFVERERQAGRGAFFDDIYPVLLDTFRYDVSTQMRGAGPLYGLPKDFSTAVFYVNLDLFEAAGVPVPYGGWTWVEFEAAMEKIAALNKNPDFTSRKIYGGYFQLWDTTLRNLVWTYGGDFFGPGGYRDVTLDEPAAQEALSMIRRLRIDKGTVYNPTGIARDGGQEFLNGNIGCLGPVGRWLTPTYKSITAFKWDVVPVPYKDKSLAASQVFVNAWGMSQATKHPDACWELMKFLCGPEGATMQSKLGLAIPPLKSVAESADFLSPPGLPKVNAKAFLDAIPLSRVEQFPPEQEWRKLVDDTITKSIQLGQESTLDGAKRIESQWLAQLDSPLRQREWGPMKWGRVAVVTIGIALVAVGAFVWKLRREKLGALDRAQQRAGYAFIAPWLIGFVALTLGPMVVSLLLSFSQWTGMNPLGEAKSVGVANYRQLFTNDPAFVQSLRVTAYYTVLAVPIGQIAALGVALLMNTKVPGIKVFRTIYFVPSVISGVALAVLWLQIFNNDYGILNRVLRPILGVFGATPPDWFGQDAKIWAIPAFVIMNLWGVGAGMVLYLAGLKGIPVSLYEAATMDGAGPLRRLWNVTLPMLSPLIFYNLLMAIIGSFQVFTQAFVMTGAGPDNATLFYVLNLYRQAFEFHNMGYASAMAWVLFVITLGLTLIVFRASKNLVYYEGLKS